MDEETKRLMEEHGHSMRSGFDVRRTQAVKEIC